MILSVSFRQPPTRTALWSGWCHRDPVLRRIPTVLGAASVAIPRFG